MSQCRAKNNLCMSACMCLSKRCEQQILQIFKRMTDPAVNRVNILLLHWRMRELDKEVDLE